MLNWNTRTLSASATREQWQRHGDEGFMSVGKEYEVLVSRVVQTEENLPGHILTLRDRHIFTPAENQYRPGQDNFDYHRKRRFLR